MSSIGYVENHGDFTKQIRVPGSGDIIAYRGCVCIIKMANLEKVDLSKEKLGRYNFKDGCKVTIGEESGLLPKLFDKVLMTMTEGEVAYVVVNANGRQQGVHQRRENSFRLTD